MYKQALTLVVKHGLAPIALNVYTDLAALMIQEGESQKALELLSPVVQHPASFCETKEKAQRLLSDLHKDFAAIFLFSDFAYRL